MQGPLYGLYTLLFRDIQRWCIIRGMSVLKLTKSLLDDRVAVPQVDFVLDRAIEIYHLGRDMGLAEK